MRGLTVGLVLAAIGVGAYALLDPAALSASCTGTETGGSCDMGITNNPQTWPTGDRIWDCCRAIAMQEGYNQAGAAPYRLNNPGDVGPGDEAGQQLAGGAEFHDGSNILHFANPTAGWRALYAKIANMVNGHSHVYGQQWTLAQINGWNDDGSFTTRYAADPNWYKGVAANLGIDGMTQGFYDYVNNAGASIGCANDLTTCGGCQCS